MYIPNNIEGNKEKLIRTLIILFLKIQIYSLMCIKLMTNKDLISKD